MSIGPIQNSAGATSYQPPVDAVPGAPDALPADLLADRRNLVRAVKGIEPAKLFGENSELTFVFDRETRKTLVRVLDRNTREVLMQLPPEYVVEMAREKQR
jgi:hypothetical protein